MVTGGGGESVVANDWCVVDFGFYKCRVHVSLDSLANLSK